MPVEAGTEVTEYEVLFQSDEHVTPAQKLTKDLRAAATHLTASEARYAVALYYKTQHYRIQAESQLRKAAEHGEPNELLRWMSENFRIMERAAANGLAAYVRSRRKGRWLLSLHGIGPVLAAGLIAHINVSKAPKAASVWRFAGLDPSSTWERGQKRPWNAELKVLAWKAGQSFMKTAGSPKSCYGPLYHRAKERYQYRNEQGGFAANAERVLEAKRIGRNTVAYSYYSVGKLPPAHIDAMARRYAVKLFLAHVHHVFHVLDLGKEPPRPYALEHLEGHTDYIPPPNWPFADE